MNFIDSLFLIPLLIIGIISSYTDIKYGKIFNKLIIISLIYIFCLYSFFYSFNYFFIRNNSNINYINDSILNGTIALLVGYFLWHFKLWSAGDGKLFAIFALLIPLGFYSNVYILYFPAFNLLINLFFPFLIVLMGTAAITIIKERKVLMNKTIKSKKFSQKLGKFIRSVPLTLIDYIFIFILMQFLIFSFSNFFSISVEPNPFLLYFSLLLIMKKFSQIKNSHKWVGYLVLFITLSYSIFLILSDNISSFISMLRIAFAFMVLIGFTQRSLDFYIKKREITKIRVDQLESGMILTENWISFLFDKMKIYKNGKYLQLFSGVDASGLNEEQVNIIKELFTDDNNYELDTYKTFPFAPFLLLAAFISILTESSFLIFLDNIFQRIVY